VVTGTSTAMRSTPSTRRDIIGAPLHWSPDARTVMRCTAGSVARVVTAPFTHSFTKRPPLADVLETWCALLGLAMFSASMLVSDELTSR
jgi:hypothetical protein